MSRMSENVGASTSRNPKGLHGLYRDNITLPKWKRQDFIHFIYISFPMKLLSFRLSWRDGGQMFFRDEIIGIFFGQVSQGKKEERMKYDSMWPVTWQVSALNYKL
jgi:hypothetical protein